MRIGIVAAGLASLIAGGAALAQAQPAVRQPAEVAALLACRSEAGSEARLRCYDAATAALVRATEGGSLVVVDREEVRRTRRSLFGFNLPRLPFFRGDRSQEEDTPDEVEGVIRSARSTDYGRYQLVLEDGAVWQTTEASSRISPPRSGQPVRIRKAALGSYMLSINNQRSLRAMRIR